MQYRELGKTGMKVSMLGFGASSLGSVFHDTKEQQSIEAVLAAVEGGINLIDVSPYYGYYKAENVLGKALSLIPRVKYYLSTKVGRYGADGRNTWDYSAKRAKESVYESLERLQIDYIDVIQVHDIEFQSHLPGGLQKVVDETLPTLHELKEEGVVRHVGITDLQLANLRWVVEHVDDGTVETVLNFCHYCLNDDALADELNFFEKHGIGVINASPFAMGLLTSRGVPDWHPAPKPLVTACAKAAEYCAEHHEPIEKVALQYSISNPRVASTLFSSANPDNVKRNIEWANEEPNWKMVKAVQNIIGDQQRVTWKNT